MNHDEPDPRRRVTSPAIHAQGRDAAAYVAAGRLRRNSIQNAPNGVSFSVLPEDADPRRDFSAGTLHPMNDEELGRLARALIDDLADLRHDDGRLIAVARTLAHVRECGRAEALLAVEDSVEWTDVFEQARAVRLLKQPTPITASPPRAAHVAPSLDAVVQRAAAGHAMTQRLIDNAPGPLTRYARALALAAAPAQLAIQWGERVEYAKVMTWIAHTCFGLQNATRVGMDESESMFPVVGVLAMIGAVTDPEAQMYDPELLISLARRTLANLSSIARAAAAAEGRDECDQVFWLDDDVMTSVRGLAPHEARLCVSQIATHLGVVGHPPRAEDLARQRAHIADEHAREKTPSAIDTTSDSIAARSHRSQLAYEQAMKRAGGRGPVRILPRPSPHRSTQGD